MRGLFSVFFSRGPQPEHRRKYLRVYSVCFFNDDPYFATWLDTPIVSHSEFFTESSISEFSTLEAYICFWVGITTFLIAYLESWLKDD